MRQRVVIVHSCYIKPMWQRVVTVHSCHITPSSLTKIMKVVQRFWLLLVWYVDGISLSLARHGPSFLSAWHLFVNTWLQSSASKHHRVLFLKCTHDSYRWHTKRKVQVGMSLISNFWQFNIWYNCYQFSEYINIHYTHAVIGIEWGHGPIPLIFSMLSATYVAKSCPILVCYQRNMSP